MNTKLIYLLSSFFGFFTTIHSSNLNNEQNFKNIVNSKISTDGKWLLLYEIYERHPKNNSILIIDNKGEIIFKKRAGNQSFQLQNNFIIYYTDENKLEILSPEGKKNKIIANITPNSLRVLQDNKSIIYHDSLQEKHILLHIKDNGDVQNSWSLDANKVSFLDINEQKKLLFYQETKNELFIIDLQSLRQLFTAHYSDRITKVIWDKKYPYLFIQDSHDKLSIVNYLSNETHNYVNQQENKLINIEAINNETILLTEKTPIYNSKVIPDLEIHSTVNRNVSEMFKNNSKQFDFKTTYTVYNATTKKQKYLPILDDQKVIVLNSQELLFYDSYQYYDYTHGSSRRIRDINLYNIENNKTTLIVKSQAAPAMTTSISPNKEHFIYLKNNKLYIYDIKKKKIIKLLDNNLPNLSLLPFDNSFKIWSSDSNLFYYTNNSNLMQYDVNSNKTKILISNSNNDIRYKIENNRNITNLGGHELQTDIILNNNKLIIHEYDVTKNSYSLYLYSKASIDPIITNTEDYISNIKYTKDFNQISYNTENYDKPANIYIFNNHKPLEVFKNTMPIEIYAWKRKEIVSYLDKEGNQLKGLLLYPKNFNPDKSYPLIVSVYELQRNLQNKFTLPSTYKNYAGFNKELLLENDFFVLLPDIFINNDGPGESGLYCVTEAIKEALRKEKSINTNQLGLRGHSFGGYLVNYIITHSNLFKAAVTGAGMVDFVRSYYYYNEGFSSPNYFQSENGQDKMSKPFHLDKELYLKNSPIMAIDKISTPILSYAGKNDKVVHWSQVRELFIATLRHHKQHISLLYNNESHLFYKEENQIDLTKRILQWFNFHLKEIYSEEYDWIKKHTTFDKTRMTPI